MTKNNDLIEDARAKLKKAKEKIDKNLNKSQEEEPKHLRSGHLDEVEIMRRRKGADDEQ